MRARRVRAQAEKAALLLALLPRRPVEFFDRVVHFAAGRRRAAERPRQPYPASSWRELLDDISRELGCDLAEISHEPRLERFRREIADRRAALEGRPFDASHTGDIHLGLLCYSICRALAPERVVETGVAYGLTSAFILQALEVNGHGVLHSIDLPPLARDADRHVGALIPERLRPRWTLVRGTSRRLLPRVFERLGGAELFVHDSLHTEENMRTEFELAARYLEPPGLLISDDVDHNTAWGDWTARRRPRFHRVVEESEKANQIGVAVLGPPPSPNTSR